MPSNRTRLILKTAAATLLAAAALGAAGGYVVFMAGWYNIGATAQHTQPVHDLLEQGMRASVERRARGIDAPPGLMAAPRIAAGAVVYRDKCAQCHGAPGFAQSDHGKAMQPVPGPLVDVARRWKPGELYWITRNGIKMSGMPAWEFHLADDELWDVVAFMQQMPMLTPAAYRNITAASAARPATPAAGPSLPPDAKRGRIALAQHACQSCHIVPGVTGPRVFVGRSLDGLAKRKFIAGTLPNTQDNLVRWIRDPHGVDPHTPMPVLGVSERDARDMTAYLLTR
ncbi:c-type cytochrome [Massilia sp. RP-1-19]|uniref:C-type cytochrome n=2 Tax=Massilia polaris TaxID=2728846 RepID=A0A848HQQ8_9BURK|nr:c-type cytochrome [Massilia polaris]